MKKETLVLIGEGVGEFLIGLAAGTIIKHVMPDCNKVEKTVLWVGTMIGTWTIGRAFGKEVFKFTNEYLDTDIEVE